MPWNQAQVKRLRQPYEGKYALMIFPTAYEALSCTSIRCLSKEVLLGIA